MASSEHFSDAELCCPHCHVNGCCPDLVEALESFRTAVGRPVIINSAYRCPVHNAEVGGAPKSQHMLGEAADVRVDGMSGADLEAVARTVPLIKGIGRSDHANYLHMDVRDEPAQWCYAENGKQEPYYPPA